MSARARAAYKALRARALEVGRIVGRLEAASRAKMEEEKAREASWLAKEKQWAGVVQAVATECAVHFMPLSFGSLLHSSVGESEKARRAWVGPG